MPTLRLVHLTEQQYAVMTDHVHAGAANNTTAEEQLPSINQEQTRLPIADATRNASLNKPPAGKEKKVEEQSDHEDEDEDNDYLDTILQESIDAVNRRSFGGHAIHRHQQAQQEIMVLSSDEESENDSSSSERRVVDAVQQFQHEMISSDEESENDSTPSAQVHVDTVQQKSGNERKRSAPIQSLDDRFNDLLAFKAKYGHCDVPLTGENMSLGRWCNKLRVSYKRMQHNEMPNMKISDEQIQRLNDAEFKWSLRGNFDNRFNDLMAFKAKYGHCDVPRKNASLGQWCSEIRVSYKKIQNNQMPRRNKLSDEQIQRLNDAGFKWCLQRNFDNRFNDLMAFKAKYGHCDVPNTGENASLGRWCSEMRVSYKKIQNNQKPHNKLSDAQIQRLNDAGFRWCLQRKFDKRFNDLMSFRAKYGNCDVPRTGENASLGRWCSEMRVSYKKIQNNQKPKIKLSNEQIQRLNDVDFKWCQ